MVIQNVLYPVTMQQEKNAFQSSQKVQNQDPAKEDQNNGQGGVILSISADALQMMQQERQVRYLLYQNCTVTITAAVRHHRKMLMQWEIRWMTCRRQWRLQDESWKAEKFLPKMNPF